MGGTGRKMLAGTTIKLMQEIISIVEEGRNAGLESENIVNNIFNRAVVDRDIVVVEVDGIGHLVVAVVGADVLESEHPVLVAAGIDRVHAGLHDQAAIEAAAEILHAGGIAGSP